jgi:hypothetical protein
MTSAFVVHMPCGNFSKTFSVLFLRSFAESGAESAMGTIWSSSPCMTSVGTSMTFRCLAPPVLDHALRWLHTWPVIAVEGAAGEFEIELRAVGGELLPQPVPEDDEVPRGAIFLFMSAKAMATIEFLQQEWINDGDFIGAGKERDPIIGRQEEGATFTIPKEPVRRRLHGIETFNVLRGGEYFFMPSLSALKWLAELKDR